MMMKKLLTLFVICAAMAAPALHAQQKPAPKAPAAKKAPVKRVDFRPYVNAVREAWKNGDMAAFKKAAADLQAVDHPQTNDQLAGALLWCRGLTKNAEYRALMQSLSADSKTSPQKQFELKLALCPAYPWVRPYNFNDDAVKYPEWKKAIKPVIDSAMANDAVKPREGDLNKFAELAYEFGDFAFCGEMVQYRMKLYPNSASFYHLKTSLVYAIRMNQLVPAMEMTGAFMKNAPLVSPDPKRPLNERTVKDRTFQHNCVKTLLGIVDKKDLASAVRAAVGSDAVAPEEEYKILLAVSEIFFRAGRVDVCHKIRDYVYQDLFHPFTRNVLNVQFVDRAPGSAAAFAISPYYDWKQLNTNFYAYGRNAEEWMPTDIKRNLKDKPQPVIEDANKAGIIALADAEALHIYVRVSDPAAAELMTEKRNGPTLECSLLPGRESGAYVNWYLSSAPRSNADRYLQNWGRGGKEYRMTDDIVFRDSFAAPDAFVAHFSFLWADFANTLPADGREWTYGMQVWGKQSLTFSGAVHETSRNALMDFRFTPEQWNLIRRNIAATVFNRYRALASDAKSVVRIWQDPVLGDPAFYDAAIVPMMEKYNEAEKRLPDLKDSELDAFFADIVIPLYNIKYTVEAARTDYIRQNLLK